MRTSSVSLWCLPLFAAACMEERAAPEAPPAGPALLAAAHSELGASGRALFSQALPGSNGRSCATCHALDEATALSVENVEARLAANPNDPLFHPLDADDPDAAELTFEHLRKGLIRVTLPLPDILPFLLPLQLPQHPPELPGFPAESLSPADKDDLIAFLRRL
jgi:hypothetical protein